jgi:thioredoxin reductase (NADPH)
MRAEFDCLIVGAGPAGLTAATYLARFRRTVLVAEGGPSRAELIPVTHNYPGFPDGISGTQLLERLRAQAARHGVVPVKGWVHAVERHGGDFVAELAGERIIAKTVLLATGIEETLPASDDLRQAVACGALRLCPVCDAFEISGKRVCVLFRPDGTDHVLFLRTYTDRLTGILDGDQTLDPRDAERLHLAGVAVVGGRVVDVKSTADGHAVVRTREGTRFEFDSVYSMLGARSRSELAMALGAECVAQGDIAVDGHQSTRVAGLYAAGDAVSGLNQLSVAVGEAATAACAIHNWLREKAGEAT